MKLEIERSDRNDYTAYPYWLIIDPEQMMLPTTAAVARMVTGPFFSREEAQEELHSNRHRYGKGANVYCLSGHATRVYRAATDKAMGREVKREASQA